ncbi:hypothetical protein K501DRAFT_173727 [Backusella circina FSU 941]|nr:hypothetical protein K501DRAFT_173727 [Backusella circina FSU 941]
MVSTKTILALSVSLLTNAMALSVSSISECPALSPRTTPATGVTDLRIDDIKMVAGLGDSIMAGFAMMGVDYSGTGALNLSAITEYRGHSYAIGADSGAITLPNFMKKYNSKLQGGSILTHAASLCYGLLCGFPLTAYRPLRDNLNAAQSGALAMNLDLELDYLIPRMKTYSLTSNYNNDWKMITIQIGSNDQCAACSGIFDSNVTPEAYGKYVDAAIQRIKKEIPKTVVNLLGTFKVSGVFPLTNGREDYCALINGGVNEFECSCASSAENLAKMDALSDGYNAQLKAIAEKYKGTSGGKFGVMYTPAPIDVTSFPIDALSNFDCFHPSIKGHEWIAKVKK